MAHYSWRSLAAVAAVTEKRHSSLYEIGEAMEQGGWESYRGKRVLLLQGPIGPFFRQLAKRLEAAGAEVHKLNFNGGDWLFYPRGARHFRGRLETLEDFLSALFDELKIDAVLLFGDCRPVHRIAHALAHRRGIEIGVFEEGYVRPNYITFERFGVNGHSLIPRSPVFYKSLPDGIQPLNLPVGNPFWWAALWGCLYFLAASMLSPLFRHYHHHRPLTLFEAWPWVRSCYRKWFYRMREAGIERMLTGPLAKRYFLVPLQVSTDSQVRVHSPFDSVEEFIRDAVASFATEAPPECLLVIKHHPMDRGYRDYGALLKRLSKTYKLGNRLLYIHDQHLPSLMINSRGVVVINSTVGLSALYHNVPVKTCGTAVYDMPGLTCQAPLARFWKEAGAFRMERALFRRFRSYLIENTQINGSFYAPNATWSGSPPASEMGLKNGGRFQLEAQNSAANTSYFDGALVPAKPAASARAHV